MRRVPSSSLCGGTFAGTDDIEGHEHVRHYEHVRHLRSLAAHYILKSKNKNKNKIK